MHLEILAWKRRFILLYIFLLDASNMQVTWTYITLVSFRCMLTQQFSWVAKVTVGGGD